MSEDRKLQEPDALSDDAIWRNDALMALNAKCQLPMSEFGKLVRCIAALSTPPAPEAASVVPEGFALVPIRLTRAMQDVLNEEGWDWPDLLVAANAISESDYLNAQKEPA